MAESRARIRGVRERGIVIVVVGGYGRSDGDPAVARTCRICKLPTPVLTGSGSKGLSQPGNAGHPRFKNAY
jgi:hypothetical protein